MNRHGTSAHITLILAMNNIAVPENQICYFLTHKSITNLNGISWLRIPYNTSLYNQILHIPNCGRIRQTPGFNTNTIVRCTYKAVFNQNILTSGNINTITSYYPGKRICVTNHHMITGCRYYLPHGTIHYRNSFDSNVFTPLQIYQKQFSIAIRQMPR